MLFFDRDAERTGAQDQWREAARLVADRWALYLEARGRCRRGARRSPFPRAA